MINISSQYVFPHRAKRIITRFLLIFGESLGVMQIMQITYSLGTVGEDILRAYIYHVISDENYQIATSYLTSSALLSSLFAGIVGDYLVINCHFSLNILMIISAVFVCAGGLVGIFILQPININSRASSRSVHGGLNTAIKIKMETKVKGKIKIIATTRKSNFCKTLTDKTRLSVRQLYQLRTAAQSPFILFFILWWLWGNVTYTVSTYCHL